MGMIGVVLVLFFFGFIASFVGFGGIVKGQMKDVAIFCTGIGIMALGVFVIKRVWFQKNY
jgi:hypothetical protein